MASISDALSLKIHLTSALGVLPGVVRGVAQIRLLPGVEAGVLPLDDAASRIELSSQANWCSQVGEIVSFLGRCDVQDSCSCGVQDGSSRNLALKASAAGRQSKGVRHSRDGYGERDVCPYGDDGPRAYGVRVGRSRHERDGGATCDAASAPSIDLFKSRKKKSETGLDRLSDMNS